MAMGVVTDLGIMAAVSASSRPKAIHSPPALTMETMEPARQPQTTGKKCFFNTSSWLYTDSASTAVAGAKNREITSPPTIKFSSGI